MQPTILRKVLDFNDLTIYFYLNLHKLKKVGGCETTHTPPVTTSLLVLLSHHKKSMAEKPSSPVTMFGNFKSVLDLKVHRFYSKIQLPRVLSLHVCVFDIELSIVS